MNWRALYAAWPVLFAAFSTALFGLGLFLEPASVAVCDTDAACAALEGAELPRMVWQ